MLYFTYVVSTRLLEAMCVRCAFVIIYAHPFEPKKTKLIFGERDLCKFSRLFGVFNYLFRGPNGERKIFLALMVLAASVVVAIVLNQR